MAKETRYAVGDLATLGGVSRRTVRYYVQEELIPPPLGLGRGMHYTDSHLKRLLQVKALQEEGFPLDAIRERFRAETTQKNVDQDRAKGRDSLGKYARAVVETRTVWRRVQIAPGIELHVSNHWELPPVEKLVKLRGWCQANFRETRRA